MQEKYKWLDKIFTANVMPPIKTLGRYPLLMIHASSWSNIFKIAAEAKIRFSGIWANDLQQNNLQITACLEFSSTHVFLRTNVLTADPQISSITPYYPAANRMERHIHDLFGIVFTDNPDGRRWTRHQAWTEDQFPLRKSFPPAPVLNKPTAPDFEYPFQIIHGSGIYEIPVGPIHAGIIEPGHFRFHAAGEDVLQLEERLGYLHKGIEKIAEGRDIEGLIKLAGRVSGDSTVAYAWATCLGCEDAYQIEIPRRANFLRAILSERERIANHLGDIAAICNDVGFSFAYYQLMRLKEIWLRSNAENFGHRLLMDCIVFGGVTSDLNADDIVVLQKQNDKIKDELNELFPIFEENSSLHDRLKKTGILAHEDALNFGTLGYVGRASGCKLDLRRDAPYPPYDEFKINVPCYETGDVLARTRIRAREILVSLELLNKLYANLPNGDIQISLEKPCKPAEGIGIIEGWRGEIFCYVGFGEDGLVDRYFPRDPSWFNWLALECLIHGNIVPDFPVCNKSINGTYAGIDL